MLRFSNFLMHSIINFRMVLYLETFRERHVFVAMLVTSRIRYMFPIYKVKVFYGQEPPSGESTTTECGVNYQLLAVITEAALWGTPSCSHPQPATDNCVRDWSQIDWSHPPPSWPVPPECLVHSINQCNLSGTLGKHVTKY